MILADTSVWSQHFRHGEPRLAAWLSDGLVLIHPSITGELACGNLGNRALILAQLEALPSADAEVMQFIQRRRLWGRELGWIDVHLLASAVLSRCALWTHDKRLALATEELGLSPES